MKSKIIIILLISFLFLCNTFTLSADSNWSIEKVDNKLGFGNQISLALDSNNHPHISYTDDYNGYLKYAYYDGNNWNIERVFNDSDGGFTFGGTSSLALDRNNFPHISYHNRSHGDLNYAYYDGNSWHIDTVVEHDLKFFHSLALDSYDHPHISYQLTFDDPNNPYPGRLEYAYFDGNSWNYETVMNEAGWVLGAYNSLALDSNDHPHISYYQFPGLGYAYYDGNSWTIETADSHSEVGDLTSIALDSNDHPHISYFNHSNNDSMYAYYDGNDWNSESVTKTEYHEGAGMSNSLALDNFDRPHISYFFINRSGPLYSIKNYSLKYAYHDDNNWTINTVDSKGNFSNDPTRNTGISLALDSNDQPHISYYDFSNYSNRDLFYASIINDENEILEENQSNTEDSKKDSNDSLNNISENTTDKPFDEKDNSDDEIIDKPDDEMNNSDDEIIDKPDEKNNIINDNEKDNNDTPGFEFILLIFTLILILLFIKKNND